MSVFQWNEGDVSSLAMCPTPNNIRCYDVTHPRESADKMKKKNDPSYVTQFINLDTYPRFFLSSSPHQNPSTHLGPYLRKGKEKGKGKILQPILDLTSGGSYDIISNVFFFLRFSPIPRKKTPVTR